MAESRALEKPGGAALARHDEERAIHRAERLVGLAEPARGLRGHAEGAEQRITADALGDEHVRLDPGLGGLASSQEPFHSIDTLARGEGRRRHPAVCQVAFAVARHRGKRRERRGDPDAAEEPQRLLAFAGGLERGGQAEARGRAVSVLGITVQEAAVEADGADLIAHPRGLPGGEQERGGQ